MSVETKGMRQLNARIEALRKIPRTLSAEWQVRTIAGAKTLVRRKTGHTGRTIGAGPITDRGATVTAAGAAVFLEKGTKPHVIRPKKGKFLRFAPGAGSTLGGRPRAGASVVFARKVNHPGTKAYPFLLPSGREALRQVSLETPIKLWNSAA
jgi:hypothetical protein